MLTTSGSNVPVATPVAISTTLPASVTALSSQGEFSKSVFSVQLSSLAVYAKWE